MSLDESLPIQNSARSASLQSRGKILVCRNRKSALLEGRQRSDLSICPFVVDESLLLVAEIDLAI